jgi:hypothetical protein
MKRFTIILLSVFAIMVLCSNGKQREQAQNLPRKVYIHYSYAKCPWFGLKNYSVCTEEFHKLVADTCITFTDNATLKYFKNLQRIASSSVDSTYFVSFDTWFSAIVEYGEYNDTVSVDRYVLEYNNKQILDSTAIFYFISKLYAADKVTYNELDENFYKDDFQKLDIGEERHSELKEKLQSLGYISK